MPRLNCDSSLIPSLQVVLIPGLLLPAIIWKNVAPQLASHGFRVLLYGVYIQPNYRFPPRNEEASSRSIRPRVFRCTIHNV